MGSAFSSFCDEFNWIYPGYDCSFRLLACVAAGIALITAGIVLDARTYWSHKKGLPGPQATLPFVGGLLSMVFSPVEFWRKQYLYACNGVSANTLLGQLMLFVTNPEVARKIFVQVDNFQLFAHPNAPHLFGKDNLIYMNPERHKNTRTLLQKVLYQKKNLRTYLIPQLSCVEEKAKHLASLNKAVDVRFELRNMAAASSQRSILGPYLDKEARDNMAQDIVVFTRGFLCLPIPLPGFGLYASIQARKRLMSGIKVALACCKERFRKCQGTSESFEPTCLIDFWINDGLGNQVTDSHPEGELENMVLDMLFASQDATTSAMVWALHVLEANPQLRTDIHKEYCEKMNGKSLTSAEASQDEIGELFDSLKLSEAVPLEILRYFPPVPMVPHVCLQDTNLGDDLTIKKGTLVIPSITGVCKNVGEREGSLQSCPFLRHLSNKAQSQDNNNTGTILDDSTSSGNLACPYIRSIASTHKDENDKNNTLDSSGIVDSKSPTPHSTSSNSAHIEDRLFDRYLVFGAGQHKCPGRVYAAQLLKVFVLVFSSDWLSFVLDSPSTARLKETAIENPYVKMMFFPTAFPESNVFKFSKNTSFSPSSCS
eukprot:GHVQ01005190.1.p1 GENE.GHVQ01005190.1~~GHVQ01005190.1.p1  ORF type:complete len:598 (+),score=55.93 GHVQ01005190.1:415-2208(+)